MQAYLSFKKFFVETKFQLGVQTDIWGGLGLNGVVAPSPSTAP